ncbi:MAG TPA: TetR/AcrR family transcriptional regulator [Albitalea sp.]|uniref:TetR/AcrR family transcriptional regulator n=1 Tax=Piscinibacter sp. TaxID=1903157 RepID=UPI002ED20C06
MAYQRTPYVESKRAEARERLVMAALSLLAQGGWRHVQMSAVAEAAGLSTGAVYLHFPSKTQLLAQAYRAQAGAELRVVTEIADQTAPAAERLAAAVRAFAQRAMSNRRLAYAMVLEPTEAEIEEERLHFHQQFIEQFRRILQSGQDAGEFELADPQVAAACIFGAITESLMGPLVLAARAGGSDPDARPLIENVLAFCFHGLRSPGATRDEAPRVAPGPRRRRK